MFDDVLDRKEGFMDHKNVILTKQKNKHFSSGVKINHDFGQKYEICSDFFFFSKKDFRYDVSWRSREKRRLSGL